MSFLIPCRRREANEKLERPAKEALKRTSQYAIKDCSRRSLEGVERQSVAIFGQRKVASGLTFLLFLGCHFVRLHVENLSSILVNDLGSTPQSRIQMLQGAVDVLKVLCQSARQESDR